MAFCPNCGTAVDGRFCQKCGAAINPGAGGSTAGSYVPPSQSQAFSAAGIPSNIVSALCYVVQIVCPIIFLMVEPYKNDRKVRFDAFQSIFMTVCFIILQVVIGILASISWELGYPLGRLLHLGEFILVVFLAIKAFQGRKVVLPVIGPLAEKQASTLA